MVNKGKSTVTPRFDVEVFLHQLFLPSVVHLTELLASMPSDNAVEEIHQSRVLIRTLRAYLDVFSPLLRNSATRAVLKDLKWLDALLAPLRNTDVSSALLTHNLKSETVMKDATDTFSLRLIHRLLEDRKVDIKSLCHQLEGRRADKLIAELAELVSAAPIRKQFLSLCSSDQLSLLTQCLDASRLRMFKLTNQSLKNPSPSHLHKLRIQAKHVHYSYGAAHSQGLIADKEVVKLAEFLHRLLGKYQDLVTLEIWLDKQETIFINETSIRKQWLAQLKQDRRKLLHKYMQSTPPQLHGI